MNRKMLVPAAVLALMLTGGAGVAFATQVTPPATGPTSAACLEANGVVKIRAAAAAIAAVAVDSAALTPAQQTAVDDQQKIVDGLKVKLDAAIDAAKASPTTANAAAAQAASDAYAAALAKLAGLPGVSTLGQKTADLEKARAALASAVAAQGKACAEPTPPTSVTTAPPTSATTAPPTSTTAPTSAPTSTTAPTSEPAVDYYADCAAARKAGVAPLLKGDAGYRAELDSDGDGVACEVAVATVPTGAVDTGWA